VVNVLKTIKQKDPGKIGDRLIGYTGIPWWAGGQLAFHEPFLGAFGVVHEWVEKGGKIVSRYETEEFKQYILFMNRLYREGLLDPDFAVLKRNIVDEKVSSGRVIMSLYHWDSIYKTWNAWEKEQPTWKINIIHNPTGPTGLSGAPVSAGGIGIMNFIPKNAENPIGAVQFVDAFMEPGNYLKLIIGEENVHWKMTGDKRTPILPIFDDERGNMFWYEPMRPGEVYYPLWKTRVEKIPAMGRAYTDTERVLLPIVTPSPIAMATMLKTTARNASSLMQLANDETLKFILGATNMSEYDKFVKRYMDAGGTDSKAEINAWYASK
jgi:putative aldouronate transport system substrate-binding protein